MSEGRSWALLLLALGGALAVLGATQTWVRLLAEGALSVDEVAVTGAAVAPLTTAAGLVALAAVVAVLAVRSWLRSMVALVVLVLAGLALVQVVTAGSDLVGTARDWWRVEVAGLADSAIAETTPWWVVCAAGLLLVMAGAVVVLVAGRRWSGLSSRYERPGSRASAPTSPAPASEADVWQALDRGEDPTAADEPPDEAGR
jgi:uncharacterized membrane protein (TIGR02234 family)